MINKKAIETQMAQEQAKVDQARTLAAVEAKATRCAESSRRDRRSAGGSASAGWPACSAGSDAGESGAAEHLMATLKIAETQARDVQDGEPAAIDTHNGIISGTVMRVDPAVQNGTVTVDVKLTGELPKGARPDLSVDGTIDLERLDNVLYVGRPAFGQENSTISLFKLDPDGKEASARAGEGGTRIGEFDSGI